MRHAKVSAIQDINNPDLVRPSDWNSTHVFDVTTITDTTYTVSSVDNGTALRFTSDSSITLNCPNNLGAGFYFWILQMGLGQITPTAASGATIVNRQSLTKTAGKNAYAALLVDINSNGVTAEYVLGGDLA